MLTGKVALVTGGTGAIGSAICRAVAGYGAEVAFTYFHREKEAQELAAELERSGRRCLAGRLDGGERTGVDTFCARVEEVFGRVDVLVNNLGAAQVMPFALIEESDWDEMMRVNLKSMFLFSKALARGMVRRRAGVILNIGSLGGQRLLEVPVHYAAAKAGVTGFTLSLAKELSRYRIRVLEVTPGLIAGGVGANVSERQMKDYVEHCAAGRPGEAKEVAELVAFAASDRASYLNAVSLPVHGGI
jgi:NAD(P)-dependent dehydrogenase (short-subunit alcohol dehydrogenase family)